LYYSDDFIEKVRSSNDIVDVISAYIKLQKKGNSYFGLCPFHNEKTPSFSVSRDKQMYYCFGCGAGGNVFTFLMQYENYSFQESLSHLAERAGIPMPQGEDSREERRIADRRQTLFAVNREAARYYCALLYSGRGKAGLDYFKRRGLDAETLKSFGLGYSDKYSDDLYRYLKQKGYQDEILNASGLFTFSEKHGMSDKFWNRVMFPIMDINNKVIAFGGRVLGDAKPKYLNSPETEIFDKSRNLYGLNTARKARGKSLILCEGYMDVIALHQGGFTSAVASLGTSLTTGQTTLLRHYAEQIYLVYDSDGAGVRAVMRALPMLRQAGLDARVVRLTPYKDPDEIIRTDGPDAFRKRMEEAENGFLFSLSVLEQEYDMASPEGRTRFIHRAASELLTFTEEIERSNYIEAVAGKYHIAAGDLRKLVASEAMKGMPNMPQEVKPLPRRQEKAAEDGVVQAQKLLLTWLIEKPELFRTVSKFIGPDDFTTELYRKAAGLVYEQAKNGKINPAGVISHFTDEKDQKEAASLFHARLPDEGSRREDEKAVKETIIRVKRAGIDAMSASLDPDDIAGMQKLIAGRKALENLEKLHLAIDE